MTGNDYRMIAKAINRGRKKKFSTYLIPDQIEMEIVAAIISDDKTFDYRWFYKQCHIGTDKISG